MEGPKIAPSLRVIFAAPGRRVVPLQPEGEIVTNHIKHERTGSSGNNHNVHRLEGDLPKVEPVKGSLGLCVERYIGAFSGAIYSRGTRL